MTPRWRRTEPRECTTEEQEVYWVEASKAHGDEKGNRALVEVLLLHRRLQAADVLAGIKAALSVGAACGRARGGGPQSRRAARQRHSGALRGTRERVISLTARRLASLPGDDRPLPSVAAYDQLLGRESL